VRISTSASAFETPYGCAVSSTSSTWRAVRPYGSRLIATTMRCQTVRSSVSSAARIDDVGQNSTGRCRTAAAGAVRWLPGQPDDLPRDRDARRQSTSPRLLQHRYRHRQTALPDQFQSASASGPDVRRSSTSDGRGRPADEPAVLPPTGFSVLTTVVPVHPRQHHCCRLSFHGLDGSAKTLRSLLHCSGT